MSSRRSIMALTSALLVISLLTVNLQFATGHQVADTAVERCLRFSPNVFAPSTERTVFSGCKTVFVEEVEYAILEIYSEIPTGQNNKVDHLTCSAMYYHRDGTFELPVAWFRKDTRISSTAKSESKKLYAKDVATHNGQLYRCAVDGVQSVQNVYLEMDIKMAFPRQSPALNPVTSLQPRMSGHNGVPGPKPRSDNGRIPQPMTSRPNRAPQSTDMSYNSRTSQPTTPMRNRALQTNTTRCRRNEFRCNNQQCISRLKVCDNIEDCAYGSDEYINNCRKRSPHCPVDQFECEKNPLNTRSSNQCIPLNKVCDNKIDCDNSDSDESGCRPVSIKPVESQVYNIRNRQISFLCEAQGYPISKMTIDGTHHTCGYKLDEKFGKIKITCKNLSVGYMDVQCSATNNLKETYSRWFRLIINENSNERSLKVTLQTSPQYSRRGT